MPNIIKLIKILIFSLLILEFTLITPVINAADKPVVSQKTKKNYHRHKKSKKRRKKKRKYCNTSSTPSYKKMKRRWHKKPSIPKPKWKNGYRDIVMYAVNTGKRFRFFIFNEDGTIDPEALKKIETIMADKDNGAEHKVHERLVKLLYKLVLYFNAAQINVISGYREPANKVEAHSHHANGSAIDFMIPGVKLPAVAKIARRLGHVGVGYYPVSGFVHVDVRDSHSYFWTDPSGPGKRNCTREIMKGAGYKFDKKWNPSKDEPIKKIKKVKPKKTKNRRKNKKSAKKQKIKKHRTLAGPNKKDDKNPDSKQNNSKK